MNNRTPSFAQPSAQAAEFSPAASVHADRKGVTIVTLSYERMTSLAALLKSLLRQELNGIQMELMICNNSSRTTIRPSIFSKVGRLLGQFPDAKIFNCSHNWASRLRYSIATLSQFDTILFIDDDIMLLEPHFIYYMLQSFKTLTDVDILSCWSTLWVEWNADYFSNVSMNFTTPAITEITEADTAGPGICMFDKRILLSDRIVNRSDNFPVTSDMDFSLLAFMEWGSRNYYLPSAGMLRFHRQQKQNALYKRYGKKTELYGRYKRLWEQGYQPVMSRVARMSKEERYRLDHAIRVLPVVQRPNWECETPMG